jgi:hypothetical protein
MLANFPRSLASWQSRRWSSAPTASIVATSSFQRANDRCHFLVAIALLRAVAATAAGLVAATSTGHIFQSLLMAIPLDSHGRPCSLIFPRSVRSRLIGSLL